jgi:hypothetical protein
MSLIALIVFLIVIGVLLEVLKRFIPMDGTIRKIVIVVVVLAAVFFTLSAFGVWDYIGGVSVPRLHR